jgi:guanosine-3',5'-bis(diphosphate) 3'-pyrophosphohydrolase
MVPEYFTDYISTPKPDGYQAIHTTVIGPEKLRVEVQIKTQRMHEVAERGLDMFGNREGVTSKIFFQKSDNQPLPSGNAGSKRTEYEDETTLRVYQNQVFCFTPKGHLIALPRRATPVDFAYAVHTDVGNRATHAKINHRPCPLGALLRNGDHVEIICSEAHGPSPDWLNFVVTSRARTEIRRFQRRAERIAYEKVGLEILEMTFSEAGREFSPKTLKLAAGKLHLLQASDICVAVGRGVLSVQKVVEAVYPEMGGSSKELGELLTFNLATIVVEPPPKIATKIVPGRCCYPVLGDSIMGLLDLEGNIVVHTVDCGSLDHRQRSVDAKWADGAHGSCVACIVVLTANEPVSVPSLVNCITSNCANVRTLTVSQRNPASAEYLVEVGVRDTSHLANLINALRMEPIVQSAQRAILPRDSGYLPA